MINDTFKGEMIEDFDQIDIQTDKLEITAWIMRCMADPMEKPPRPAMGYSDLLHFFADIIIEKVANLDQIAATARVRVMEREKASR